MRASRLNGSESNPEIRADKSFAQNILPRSHTRSIFCERTRRSADRNLMKAEILAESDKKILQGICRLLRLVALREEVIPTLFRRCGNLRELRISPQLAPQWIILHAGVSAEVAIHGAFQHL